MAVQLLATGCPNSCRHCGGEFSPPFGALISFDDIEWIVSQVKPFARRLSLNLYSGELTAHPDYVRLEQLLARESSGTEPDPDGDVFSTNGYGIVRSATWEADIDALKEIGMRRLSLTFHGIGDAHDWFARRAGAYDDLLTTMRRMASRGVGIMAQYFLDRRNIADLPGMLELVKQWSEEIGQQLDLGIEIPCYTTTDRLSIFEGTLRPSREDLEPIEAILAEKQVCQPLDDYAEAAWTRRILETAAEREAHPTAQDIANARVGCDEGVVAFQVDKDLNVWYRPERWEWPKQLIGNLKKDPIPEILQRASGWRPPTPIPPITELARRYGDAHSRLIHPVESSVRHKWIHRFTTEYLQR